VGARVSLRCCGEQRNADQVIEIPSRQNESCAVRSGRLLEDNAVQEVRIKPSSRLRKPPRGTRPLGAGCRAAAGEVGAGFAGAVADSRANIYATVDNVGGQ
jgi:hypothetical protein